VTEVLRKAWPKAALLVEIRIASCQ